MGGQERVGGGVLAFYMAYGREIGREDRHSSHLGVVGFKIQSRYTVDYASSRGGLIHVPTGAIPGG